MATAWFDKGRPALFAALSNVCEQIGQDLLAEIQNHNSADGQTSSSREIQDGSTERPDVVIKLEAENAELRRQLAIAQSSNFAPHATNSHVEPTPPRLTLNEPVSLIAAPAKPAGINRTCQGDCAKVLRRYHALSANFKTAKDALHRRKEERNKWIRHAEYLRRKIHAAEDQYNIHILDHKAQDMEPPTAAAMEADETLLNPSLSFMSDEGPAETGPQLPELAVADNQTSAHVAEPHANSETTQGEASDDVSLPPPELPTYPGDEVAVIKQEPSSDVPEVISEREVRKRKRTHEESAVVAKPKIKAELVSSSSPIMSILSIQPTKFHTQESIDLGDIVQKIQTPRKRQLLDQDAPQSEVIQRSKFTTLTPIHATAQAMPQSAIIPRQSSALMPLSLNVRTARPKSLKTQQKSRWHQLNESIGSLAEDGTAYMTGVHPGAATTPRVDSSKSRLDALLNGPVAAMEEEDIISKLPKRSDPRTPSYQTDLGIPGRRQLPFDKNGRRSNKSTPVQPLATKPVFEPKARMGNVTSPRRITTRSEFGPLRLRPLSELRLEDFKVNPQANEGHDFAFSEVVRDKGDRACLPGCVDMHCCGKEFRALAISQRPNPPLTAAQRLEEQKLLEDFLGDYSYRLASMDKDERLEVWIEAKTQELANKYGKHRHRFSRMQSPPGFWDADFPDTQKLEADREEAAKRSRRAVAERYREAKRPGGRWIFKDEL